MEASLAVPIFFLVMFSLLYIYQLLGLQLTVQHNLSAAARQYSCYGTLTGESVESLIQDHIFILWKRDEPPEKCYAEYSWSVPYLGSGLWDMSFYQQTAISPYEGRSMVPEETSGDYYVYVAENGRVYHCDENCTYLNLGIQRVLWENIQAMRSQSGGKYYECEFCFRNNAYVTSAFVYITPYGNRYHRDKTCSGLKRTVRKLKRSEAGGLPPCSKCGIRN